MMARRSGDRADFTALGASAAVLREIDACARRAPARAVARARRDTTPAPAATPRASPRPSSGVTTRPAPAAAPAAPAAVPPRVIPADAARSGWRGTPERGTAAQRLRAPLVFVVMDASGAPLAAAPVTVTATNATLDAASVVTDGKGRAAVGVTFGTKALPAVITASVGVFALPDTILPDVGAPAHLTLTCGGQTLAGLLVLSVGQRAALEVRALDSFDMPVAGDAADSVAVASADERVLRVGGVTSASGAATAALDPRAGGTTVLTVAAAGIKRSLTAAVLSDPVPGVVPCPR